MFVVKVAPKGAAFFLYGIEYMIIFILRQPQRFITSNNTFL